MDTPSLSSLIYVYVNSVPDENKANALPLRLHPSPRLKLLQEVSSAALPQNRNFRTSR